MAAWLAEFKLIQSNSKPKFEFDFINWNEFSYSQPAILAMKQMRKLNRNLMQQLILNSIQQFNLNLIQDIESIELNLS